MPTWSDQLLGYHFGLDPDIRLPEGIELLYPYDKPETRRCMQAFYKKYYSDGEQRALLLGINPGRFGAGVTGVPFTDPIRLAGECGIPNNFSDRAELSSSFVYEFIDAMGGTKAFYSRFLISSICPLGFLRNGKNYNYYDDRALQQAVMPVIRENLRALVEYGAVRSRVFSMGKGKNFAFLEAINAEMDLFDEVIPLPHPRWVMQYRLKHKARHIEDYTTALKAAV